MSLISRDVVASVLAFRGRIAFDRENESRSLARGNHNEGCSAGIGIKTRPTIQQRTSASPGMSAGGRRDDESDKDAD